MPSTAVGRTDPKRRACPRRALSKSKEILRWFLYSFFAINWLSAAFAFANWLIYPSSAISWGGGYGRFLAGETGFFTSLLEPLGTGILLSALALVAFIWIYNYDFSKWLKAKGEQTDAKVADDEIDTFRDESENIFAKDKLQDIRCPTIHLLKWEWRIVRQSL